MQNHYNQSAHGKVATKLTTNARHASSVIFNGQINRIAWNFLSDREKSAQLSHLNHLISGAEGLTS